MARDVVEVVVRFGETVLDVRYVTPTETYRIGTAPDVDFAVQGHTSFPLVENGTLRVPLGTPAMAHGATTRIRLARATLDVTRVARPRTHRVRKWPDRRAPMFIVASLLVHLSIWLAAAVLEPFEVLVVKHEPRLRYAHLGEPPPEPPPTTTAKPQPAALAGAANQARHGVAAVAARERAQAYDVGSIAKRLGNTDAIDAFAKDQSRELYDEDAANQRGFGGASGHFDPTQREGWGTVASGEYVTFAFDAKLCPDKSCKITGPFPPQGIRSYLHAYMPAIYDCYTRYASEPGTIVLDFTIQRGDGSVHDAKGRGLGETGTCAARVVAAIDFKAFEADTHVRYPIRFN